MADSSSTAGPLNATPNAKPWRRLATRLGLATLVPALLASWPLANVWRNLGRSPDDARKQSYRSSAQFDASSDKFRNKLPVIDPDFGPLMRDWMRGGNHTSPESALPLINIEAKQYAERPKDELRVTWLGHSTMLIELDGALVLTDPVWGERSSPFEHLGPKRFHEPPLSLSDLPDVDAVVISHDHYDHLDAGTITALAEKVPLFLVPLGVGAHLEYWGVPAKKIVELDWWQEHEVAGIRLVATPARHFSGRAVTDRDETLWASWTMLGPQHRVFFSGDTGMFPGFREIGERFGPFDLSMVESGAYNRLWSDVHLGPEQAVAAAVDLKSKLMMPVHWGTFDLALHSWTEPVERVMAAAEAAKLPVYIPRPGERFTTKETPIARRWWPEVPWKSAQEDPIISSGLADSKSPQVDPKEGDTVKGTVGDTVEHLEQKSQLPS